VIYKDVLNDILKINDNIRFATICDMDGNISQAGHHESTKNQLSFNESIALQKFATKSWKSSNLFSSKIGQEKFVIAAYKKLKRITIGFGKKHLIYMTVDVNADHDKIINSVLKIEKKYLKK